MFFQSNNAFPNNPNMANITNATENESTKNIIISNMK